MKKNLNQNLINLIEYYNLINANFLLSNNPIKRVIGRTTNTFNGTNLEQLNKLKKTIKLIIVYKDKDRYANKIESKILESFNIIKEL